MEISDCSLCYYNLTDTGCYFSDITQGLQQPSSKSKEPSKAIHPWGPDTRSYCEPAFSVLSPKLIDEIEMAKLNPEQKLALIIKGQRSCSEWRKRVAITADTPQEPQHPIRNGLLGDLFNASRSVSGLAVGTNLEFFETLTDVDTLLKIAAEQTAQAQDATTGEAKPFSQCMKEKLSRQYGFNGQIKEITATLLLNRINADTLDKVPNQDYPLLRFLIEMGLFSSAKIGRAATFVTAASVSLRVVQRPRIVATFRNYTGKHHLDALDLLLDDSQFRYQESVRKALRETVSAGLPGLGKKR